MDETTQKVILCVDDEIGVVAALRRLLHPLPYQVLTANDGEEAVLVANATKPDLIILDLSMPKMDGHAVIRQLREHGFEKLPIVILTADVSPRTMFRSYNEGGDYYITKPFENEYIINIIEYLIGNPPANRRQWLEEHL